MRLKLTRADLRDLRGSPLFARVIRRALPDPNEQQQLFEESVRQAEQAIDIRDELAAVMWHLLAIDGANASWIGVSGALVIDRALRTLGKPSGYIDDDDARMFLAMEYPRQRPR